MGAIYFIEINKTKKIYIGQTTNVKRRIRQHIESIDENSNDLSWYKNVDSNDCSFSYKTVPDVYLNFYEYAYVEVFKNIALNARQNAYYSRPFSIPSEAEFNVLTENKLGDYHKLSEGFKKLYPNHINKVIKKKKYRRSRKRKKK